MDANHLSAPFYIVYGKDDDDDDDDLNESWNGKPSSRQSARRRAGHIHHFMVAFA